MVQRDIRNLNLDHVYSAICDCEHQARRVTPELNAGTYCYVIQISHVLRLTEVNCRVAGCLFIEFWVSLVEVSSDFGLRSFRICNSVCSRLLTNSTIHMISNSIRARDEMECGDVRHIAL